jgi:hypothetical protein
LAVKIECLQIVEGKIATIIPESGIKCKMGVRTHSEREIKNFKRASSSFVRFHAQITS